MSGNDVTFDVTFEHFGNGTATNFVAADDLDAVFGAGTYSVTSISKVKRSPELRRRAGLHRPPALPLNSSPRARPSARREAAVIRVVASVGSVTDQGVGVGNYSNALSVSTNGPGGVGGPPSPTTRSPAPIPIPTGPAIPGTAPGVDDGASPFSVTPNATVGVAKSAADAGSQMTFDFHLEHFGNTTATNLTMNDDLDAVFGAGNYAVDSISLVGGPGTIGANGSFTGKRRRHRAREPRLDVGTGRNGAHSRRRHRVHGDRSGSRPRRLLERGHPERERSGRRGAVPTPDESVEGHRSRPRRLG